ncbi:MAG: DUF3617 family protein [Elusimicrobia bacterium]|nr:DUF3617 family protein [Elusimicrobiota bacterium]
MKNPFAVALTAMLLSVSAFATAPRIRPGKWTVASTMQLPPGVRFTPPPTTRVTCYSKKDIDSGKAFRAIPKNCHEDYYRVKGKTVRWEISCNKGRGGPLTMIGELTSTAGTSYEENVTNKRGSRVVGGMKIRGKRIGNCQ